MGKKRKHMIAFLLLIAMMSGIFMNANRADALWYWQKEYDYTRWFKKYHVSVYRENFTRIKFFSGDMRYTTGFDYKGDLIEPIVIAQTSDFSISKQTTDSLSAKFGSSVKAADIGASNEVSATTTETSAYSWGVSTTITRTVPAAAPRGYYAYNVCINTRAYDFLGTHLGTVRLLTAESEPFRAIIRSSTGNFSDAGVYSQ